eukprot:12297894-Alexandrium_andersonii.AAC.1
MRPVSNALALSEAGQQSIRGASWGQLLLKPHVDWRAQHSHPLAFERQHIFTNEFARMPSQHDWQPRTSTSDPIPTP